MRTVVFLAVMFLLNHANAQSGTDIWLFRVEKKDGKPVLKRGKNVTARKGYDNQPAFSEDTDLLYFSSDRDTSKRIHIFQYYVSGGGVHQTTDTKTSEYSPVITPIGNLSYLMVEPDSSQHIWQRQLNRNRDDKRIFSFRDSIGYYAWVDKKSAIIYKLAGRGPNQIVLINSNGEERNILEGVGRGMAVFKNAALIVMEHADTTYALHLTDYLTTTELMKTPGKSQDMAVWGNYLLMADGAVLYGAELIMKNGRIEALKNFTPLADLSSSGLKRITRLAVSRNEKWIAIVAADE